MLNNPFISIIIATYNAQELLPVAINSIRNQLYKNFELIVIDGLSTDKTVEIIENNKDIVSYTISEKDKGIYDAWNKGIKLSKGKWIMFIGADDELLPNALLNYASFIEEKKCDNYDYISSKINLLFPHNSVAYKTIGSKWEWPKFNHSMMVAHPGSLHSKKMFQKVGYYDTKYKITGDYELLMRSKEKLKAEFLDTVTLNMKKGGASDSLKAINEYYKILITTGNLSVIKATWYKYLLTFRYIGGHALRRLKTIKESN